MFGAFARPAELYHQFNFLLKKINESIKFVDPVFFDMLTQLHKRVKKVALKYEHAHDHPPLLMGE